MAVAKTSLSAGEIIRAILIEDAEVTKRTKKIFPVNTDKAELPYIIYRRAGLVQAQQKTRLPYDEVRIEMICCTAKYGDGVELAEAVRGALEGRKYTHKGLTMSSCYLADSEESNSDDAFLQTLVFNVKI